MEIRANYVMVGLFTILVLLGGVGFTLWIGTQGKNVPMTDYEISFNESVKGLSVNNDVLFNGIRVGRVSKITISPVTPGEVKVLVTIASDTPVRMDSVASLELRGITGVSVVSISGGTAESPLMQVPEDGIGHIQYEPSPFSSVVAQIPDVMASANQVLQRIEGVFSDENTQALSNTLASFNQVSGVLSARAESIDNILAELESSTKNLNLLLASANTAMTTDIKDTSQSWRNISRRIDSTLNVMEPGLKQFSTQGLADMRLLVVEMRNMVHVLTRVGEKLDSDPRRYLFGEPVKEYKP